MNIFEIYASTTGKSEDEFLKWLRTNNKTNEKILIILDFYSKVGFGIDARTVERYGPGVRYA